MDALVEASRPRALDPFVLCQHNLPLVDLLHFPFVHILPVVIAITCPFIWLSTVTIIHLSVTVHPMRDTPILRLVYPLAQSCQLH